MQQLNFETNPLKHWSTQAPDSRALAVAGRTYTYGQLRCAADEVASLLAGHGVTGGTTVSCALGNGLPFVAAFFACLELGAVMVPSDVAVDGSTLEARFGATGSALLLVDKRAASVNASRYPEGSVVALDEWLGSCPQGAVGASADVRLHPVDPDAVACVMFTSGSTGVPKGVRLTAGGLMLAAHNLAGRMGLSPDDRVLAPMPLSHLFGMVSGMLTTMSAGACLYLMERYNPVEALSIMDGHAITVHHGVPSMIKRELDELAADPGAFHLDALRTGMMAGAYVSPETVVRAQEEWNARMVIAYGSTETVNVSCGAPEDPLDVRAHTVGRPFGTVQVEVRPAGAIAAGECLKAGTAGELYVKGPSVSVGYLGGEDGLLSEDGMVATGDLALIDADGYLHIVGRIKNIIIRNGNNIVPSDLERVYADLPGIEEACVFGFPHKVLGEGVALAVAGDYVGYSDQFLRSLACERVARYAAPDVIVRADVLPKLLSGKTDVKALRRMIASGADGGVARNGRNG